MENFKVNEILRKIIKTEVLVNKHPDMFDFSKLSYSDKLYLLTEDTKFYFDKISPTITTLGEKVFMVVNSKKKDLSKKFELTEDEVKKTTITQYAELIKADFEKYIRVERFKDLNKGDQADLFIKNPVWVIENTTKPPRLTVDRLSELARQSPKFIDSYIADFSEYSTRSDFWVKMIKHDIKYEDIFLKNTGSCSTTTDIRQVIRKLPHLIKKIDEHVLSDSKLTIKEWIYLINEVINKNEKIFKDWEFSDELVEIFRLDLMSELLKGESKLSVRLQNTMKGLFDAPSTAESVV